MSGLGLCGLGVFCKILVDCACDFVGYLCGSFGRISFPACGFFLYAVVGFGCAEVLGG